MLLGRIIRKARNAASHPTSHKQHGNNQAGNGLRQTNSDESHSHLSVSIVRLG